MIYIFNNYKYLKSLKNNTHLLFFFVVIHDDAKIEQINLRNLFFYLNIANY